MDNEVPTLNDLRQQVFNKMVAGLSSQDWEQSILRDGSCAYRDPAHTNRRCAVGWLIPDEEYILDWEGKTVNQLTEGSVPHNSTTFPTCPTVIQLNNSVGIDFLTDCQEVHDKGYAPDDMQEQFRALAKKWAISWSDAIAASK